MSEDKIVIIILATSIISCCFYMLTAVILYYVDGLVLHQEPAGILALILYTVVPAITLFSLFGINKDLK